MQRLRCWLIVCCLLGLATSAHADEQIKWKLKAGDTFYSEEKTETKMEIMTIGQNIPMEMTNLTISQYTVKEVRDDGSIVIERVVKKTKNEMSTPMPGADMDALGKALEGLKFTVTFDKNMNITKLEGYQDLIKRLKEIDEAGAEMLKGMMPEESLRKTVEELFGVVPTKTIKVGDTWDRKSSMSLGPMGKLTVDVNYKLAELNSAEANIEYTMKMKHDPSNKGDENSPIPFKISKMDVQTGKSKGKLVFDVAKGRLKKGENEISMVIKMVADANGQEIEMEIHQEIKASMKLSDQDPSK